MKIAVVNRTNLKNYGSVLQVYALCHTVERLGYNAEVVWESGNKSKNWDFRPNKVVSIAINLLFHPSLLWTTFKRMKAVRNTQISPEKIRLFDEFVQKYFNRRFYSNEELISVAESSEYVKFICGSDQVWMTTTLYPDPLMYLRFAPKEKRIAYAPSLGRNFIPSYNLKTIKMYIQDIPCLSIREDDGKRIIQEKTGLSIPVVADPTLLMNDKEWSELAAKIETPKDYLLCYFLDEPSSDIKQAISELSKEQCQEIVIIGSLSEIQCPNEHIHRPVMGPSEFLTYVSNANFVITDSYHGMLFSIIYQKQFWAVERAYQIYDQSSRQLTVLSRLGIENRYVKGEAVLEKTPIDYNSVNEKLSDFISYSLKYLDESIKK